METTCKKHEVVFAMIPMKSMPFFTFFTMESPWVSSRYHGSPSRLQVPEVLHGVLFALGVTGDLPKPYGMNFGGQFLLGKWWV